ncbi:MAG: hypothetical protein AB7U23_13710 [Dehalococcoidia bacterium]
MRHRIILACLAALLLTMGVAVGRLTPSDDRSSQTTEAPPLLSVAADAPLEPAAPPMLVGRYDPTLHDGELVKLKEALDGMRAEHDRLAAELARFQEQAKRWDALIEIERVQRAANETAAIATSRNAISALAQMQASAMIDEDRDGTGEYAGFLEMSGGAVGRMANGRPLVPPVLSGAFRTLTKHGEVYRNGYLYRIFLPDGRGNGIGEGPEGFMPSQIDPDLAETTWCMYAWPAVGGEAGQKTYFTNQAGDVLVTEDPRYAGPGSGPAADAAFRDSAITGRVAIGAAGNDGNTWTQAN